METSTVGVETQGQHLSKRTKERYSASSKSSISSILAETMALLRNGEDKTMDQ